MPIGAIIPISGERVLLFASSPLIKSSPHTINVTNMEAKLYKERLLNRDPIGA